MCKRNINRSPLPCPQLRTWPTTQACTLTGNRRGNLLVHRPKVPSTELHQPGLFCSNKILKKLICLSLSLNSTHLTLLVICYILHSVSFFSLHLFPSDTFSCLSVSTTGMYTLSGQGPLFIFVHCFILGT